MYYKQQTVATDKCKSMIGLKIKWCLVDIVIMMKAK